MGLQSEQERWWKSVAMFATALLARTVSTEAIDHEEIQFSTLCGHRVPSGAGCSVLTDQKCTMKICPKGK